jgi:hypothetical protein
MNDSEYNQDSLSEQELRDKIKNEIAPVPWQDLQVVYARGIVILASRQLDLVEITFEISKNNTELVNQWMDEGMLSVVQDEQALKWFENKTELLTSIIKPWVLIQEIQQSGA